MIGECCDSHIFINLAKLSSESLLRRLKKPILKKFKAQQDAQLTQTKKTILKKIKVEQDAQLRASFSSSSGAQVGNNDEKAQFLSCEIKTTECD